MKATFFFLCFLALHALARAQGLESYQKEVFTSGGVPLPYRLLKPPSDSGRYPLIIFLHGAGHKGTDNEVQLRIGGKFFLRDDNRKNYPAYVLFPQCPQSGVWADFQPSLDSFTGKVIDLYFTRSKTPTPVTAALKLLLDSLVKVLNIDRGRIYLGGYSQGAMGVLDLAARYPDVFAAGFSIAGAGNLSNAKYISGKVPLWIFHGADDPVIPVSFSRQYYRKLQREHAEVKYSEYPGVLHNSFINAFSEPDLLPWLFSKVKNVDVH